MKENKKKKDRALLLCLVVTALIGVAAIVAKRNFVFLAAYIPLQCVSIPTLYFNYSLCKWEVTWHAAWNEKNPSDGEPSSFRLMMGKIGEWALFVFALSLALVPPIA